MQNIQTKELELITGGYVYSSQAEHVTIVLDDEGNPMLVDDPTGDWYSHLQQA